MPPYQFKSNETNYVIVSNGNEKEGDIVTTVQGGGPNTILVASAPIDHTPRPVLASVKGLAGLYLSIPGGAPEDTKLRWSKEEYTWVFNYQASRDSYQVIPATGEDLYWYDKFGIGPVVIVVAGKNVEPPRGEWTIRA